MNHEGTIDQTVMDMGNFTRWTRIRSIMNKVVFYIEKETNKFLKYFIVSRDMRKEDLDTAIRKHNERTDVKDRVEIVTDQHVADAILSHQTIDSIKGIESEIREEVESIRSCYNSVIGILDDIRTRIKKLEEEKNEE